MAEIGKYCELTVIEEVDFGLYLDGGTLGKILLPSRDVPKGCEVGDEVEVFLYLDTEDRLVATNHEPYATVGECAYLECVAVTDVGAFMDWGLLKDLFVPFAEQYPLMEKGRCYIVRVFLDATNRIAATAKIEKYIDAAGPDFLPGAPVDLLIHSKTDLGYKAIVDDKAWGVLYKNEVFQVLETGQWVDGFIKEVRSDGKLDLCLQPPGKQKVLDLSELILERLKENEGYLPVSDKSPPVVISGMFNASKQTFKRAVGNLYKARLVTIEKDGIRLV